MNDTLPHSIEAEQQLLGALLTTDSLIRVQDRLKPEHFFDPVHAKVYRTIIERDDAGGTVGAVPISHLLNADDGLAELGGPTYLMRLAAASTSTFAVSDYADIIIENSERRRVIETATVAIEHARDASVPLAKLTAELESEVSQVAEKSAAKPLVSSFLAGAADALEQVNTAYRDGAPPGMQTGIRALDNVFGSLAPGTLTIIGGRPSMGKTTVCHGIALRAALRGEGVFFGSLEMQNAELSLRAASFLMARRGLRVPYSEARKGNITEEQFRALAGAFNDHQTMPMLVGERECRELPILRAAIKRAAHRLESGPGLKLVVIDYVQRIHDPKANGFYEMVSNASDQLKTLALSLNVPVIVAAQLSRGVDQRDPPIPMMSDLKDSGRLEEDADNVIFCYREEKYLQEKLDRCPADDLGARADLEGALSACSGQMDLVVAKQRSGALATISTGCDMPLNFVGDREELHPDRVRQEAFI